MNTNEMLDSFLRMTWYNPLFMLVAIGAIWFIPGIIVRRIAEKKFKESKAAAQAKKISRLYPKEIKK